MTLQDWLAELPLVAALPLATMLGLIAGSFIATLVLRWGAGRSISGRSVCDGCGRTLGLLDLVPLLSWLARRGRCSVCGAAIDPLHLRVELGCAAIGAASVLLLPGAAGWCLALFGWLLLPLALLDLRHYWLPDILTGVLAVAGLVLAGPILGSSLPARLTGAIAGGVTLGVLAWLFVRARGREGMGGGDPKLAAAIGCWIGWVPLPFMFAMASFGGIIWALLQKGDAPVRDRHIPFGAFMAAAAWLAVPVWTYLIIG